MKDKDITLRLAKELNIPIKDSKKMLQVLRSIVEEALINGDKIQILGFGTFEVRERKSRRARNPITREELHVNTSYRVNFKNGATLKRVVNEKMLEKK